MATIYAKLIVESLQPLSGGTVTAVEDKSVGDDYRCWANILIIGPERGAGGRAGGTQYALGGVFEACSLFYTL